MVRGVKTIMTAWYTWACVELFANISTAIAIRQLKRVKETSLGMVLLVSTTKLAKQ